MTSDELRAAAVRLIAFYRDSRQHRAMLGNVPFSLTEDDLDDINEVAQAIASLPDLDRLRRESDETPVDSEWLRTLGGEGLHADEPFYGWADDVGWVLAWHEGDNTLSIYGERVLHEKDVTRGDVVRLAGALNITLKEPKP